MGFTKKIIGTILIFTSILFIKNWFFQENNLRTQHKFQLYRDQHGIPHIVAKTKNQIAFGIGYAEAQDRLYTLFIRRMFVQGRLAQLFGQSILSSDKYIRNFDFYNVARMNIKLLDQDTRNYMQSYANGINQYVKNLKILPFQFYLIWADWENWIIQDSLALVNFFSFNLQFDWMYQIARQRLLQTVGFQLAQKIIPFGQNNLFRQVTIINDQQLKSQGRYKQHSSDYQRQILMKHWGSKNMSFGSIKMPIPSQEGAASNGWVIGGQHTFHGKPILANDPHLGLVIPSFFYMLQIILLDQNNEVINQCFGVIVDGLPSISIGVNKYFAWGSTASYVDNKDVYSQTIRVSQTGHPQYLFQGNWHDFIIRQQLIKIRGSQPLLQKFYHTHRGPVIENIFLDMYLKYGYPLPPHFKNNHTISISASLYQPDNTSIKGLLGLALATQFNQFQNFADMINCPNIDSVWIDKNGQFGYTSVGRIPKRQIPQMGSFIKDGNTTIYDMGDFFNVKQRPRIRNPKKGYISMANNKFAEDGFDLRASLHQISTGRSYRIDNMIQNIIKSKKKFDFQTMKAMQLDQFDDFLSQAFPSVLEALTKLRSIWSNPQTQIYYKRLKQWNYNVSVDSIEASLYHVWQNHFQQLLLKSTQLTQQQRVTIVNHAFFEIYQFNLFVKMGNGSLGHEQYKVCENSYTQNLTQTHPCLVNIALAFKKLPIQLQKLFNSKNIQDYKWGKIHNNVFRSIPWSQIPILRNIWQRQYQSGGNSRTINVAILSHQTKSYKGIAGPIFRFITDLNRTIFSYDTGQTDRVYSPFYDNFVGKNLYVEYVPKNPLKQQVITWKKTIDML